MNYKKITSIMLLLIMLLGLSSCDKAEETPVVTESIPSTEGLFGVYDDEDFITTWNEKEVVDITLEDNNTIAKSDYVQVSGNIITITNAGVYRISGTLQEGQIIVSANKNTDTVRLILNDIDIKNSTQSPIYIKEANKTIITLAENTTNTLSDGSNYTYADAIAEEPNATIFSKDDLTINGSGSLSITANFNNAIQSKDDLVITGGTFDISSVNNGIKGKDSISIYDGTFTLKTNGDAIQASNTEDATKGFVAIDGGTFDITSQNDGIQAETDLKISNGTITLLTATGATGAVIDSTISNKGLKATKSIIITGGNFTLNTLDDAIHTNGTLQIQDGTFEIASGDDGMHADDTLQITKGTINISNSYEGLEASNIIIDGGNIKIRSTDDGMNAAGGSDGTTASTPFRQDNFVSQGEYYLTINGGTIIVDADGDGIDSNKDITMNGGNLIIYGPTTNDNSAIDCDGTFNMNGGTLMALGSAGMSEVPSETSGQVTISFYFNSIQQAGNTVTLKSVATGEIIFENTGTKSFQNIVFSSNEFVVGESYEVYLNGTLITTVELSSQILSISEDGSVQQGNMFGGFGGGGQPPRG